MKKTSIAAIGLGCGILAVAFFFLLKIELVGAPGDLMPILHTATSTVVGTSSSPTPKYSTTTVGSNPTPTPPKPTPKPSGGISPTGSPFGHARNYTIGSRVFYLDGLIVTLVRIDDSRCKPGATCIWAGELAPVFSVTGGNFGTTVSEIPLGTIQTVSKIGAGYTFTLGTTTEHTVALTVSK